eukprot:767365-Hanusia_phi.AAC.1
MVRMIPIQQDRKSDMAECSLAERMERGQAQEGMLIYGFELFHHLPSYIAMSKSLLAFKGLHAAPVKQQLRTMLATAEIKHALEDSW